MAHGYAVCVGLNSVDPKHYELFHKKIRQRMPSDQTPNHFVIGPPNHDYDDQKPFVVD